MSTDYLPLLLQDEQVADLIVGHKVTLFSTMPELAELDGSIFDSVEEARWAATMVLAGSHAGRGGRRHRQRFPAQAPGPRSLELQFKHLSRAELEAAFRQAMSSLSRDAMEKVRLGPPSAGDAPKVAYAKQLRSAILRRAAIGGLPRSAAEGRTALH